MLHLIPWLFPVFPDSGEPCITLYVVWNWGLVNPCPTSQWLRVKINTEFKGRNRCRYTTARAPSRSCIWYDMSNEQILHSQPLWSRTGILLRSSIPNSWMDWRTKLALHALCIHYPQLLELSLGTEHYNMYKVFFKPKLTPSVHSMSYSLASNAVVQVADSTSGRKPKLRKRIGFKTSKNSTVYKKHCNYSSLHAKRADRLTKKKIHYY